MTAKNNIVHLPDQQDTDMNRKKPVYYTIAELNKHYPTIHERGWTDEDLEILVKRNFVAGRNKEEGIDKIQINKESFEEFLAYHNQYLKNLVNRLEDDVDELKKNKPSTDKQVRR